MEQTLEKHSLEELIAMYREFPFSYLNCSSKKLVGISQTGECLYEPKSDSEIEQQKQTREQFEHISKALIDAFHKAYNNRQLPNNIIGADRIAGTVSNELNDQAQEICKITFEKNDPVTLINIAQDMEIAWHYRGTSASKLLEKICHEMLPKISIACDFDTGIYIIPLYNRFCAITESKENFINHYKQGIETTKEKLINKQNDICSELIN